MATYKKKDKVAKQLRKDQAKINAESTTKEVFEGLESGANKAEVWILKNQKSILIVIGVVLASVLAYMAYMRYVQEPAEIKAANELAYPKAYFDQAQANSIVTDSLYTLALNGADGKYGLLDIADKYSSTKAGNLASYYAGLSYLKLTDYKNAIKYLDDFSSDDAMLGTMAKGAIGDAFANIDQQKEALDYYEEAANLNPNDYTTPLFLDKAAATALSIGENKKAMELYTRIKNDFSKSDAAKDIVGKINKAKYATK
jgi:tetratricopeptide (TPR) repeat protein